MRAPSEEVAYDPMFGASGASRAQRRDAECEQRSRDDRESSAARDRCGVRARGVTDAIGVRAVGQDVAGPGVVVDSVGALAALVRRAAGEGALAASPVLIERDRGSE